jgi:TrmH family RNA methyltransferase
VASPHDDVLTARSTRVRRAKGLARRNSRREQKLFLVEGTKGLQGALGTADCVETVFATPELTAEHPDLVAEVRAGGGWWHLADEDAVASLCGATTPQGLVAVCRFIDVGLDSVLDGSAPILICADMRDPGNAGAIIRVADASGARGVLLAGNSVDVYNDKTVRASVGSLFQVPIVIDTGVVEAISAVRAAGYTVLAADGAGELPLFSAQTRDLMAGKVAWLFGNEAWGLPREIQDLADHVVAIPIPGRAESLNLATAAAVCLYARFALDVIPEPKPGDRPS